MNKKNYISIELKRKLKALPLLLLSTVILSIFIGIIAYIAFLYANDNKDVSKKKIVFMSEDNHNKEIIGLSETNKLKTKKQ